MQNLQNHVDIVTGFTAKGLHEALELNVSYKNVRHVSFFYAIYMLTDRQGCTELNMMDSIGYLRKNKNCSVHITRQAVRP